MNCPCPTPNPHGSPTKANTCVRCNRRIPPEWSTANIGRFYDRLQEAIGHEAGDEWITFRAAAQAREIAGREKFRYAYLGRDNIAEASEEISDLVNYLALEILRQHRDGDGDAHIEMALDAAYHAFKAFQALNGWKHKRKGAP